MAQDYARALGGGFQKHEGYLESDEHIVSWAIGHLVELAEPEEYDEALKRWSIKTLPVLPEQFKLRPDARNKKQLDVLKRLIKRDDVDEIVNGCDAGREGELIFQYIMDVAKTHEARPAPVGLVDDEGRDPRGLREPAAGRGDGAARGGGPLALRGRLARRDERHPRGDREGPLPGRRRVARPGADADARADRPPRPRDRRVRAPDLLPGRRPVRARRAAGVRRPLVRGQGGPHLRAGGRRRRRRSRGRRRRPGRDGQAHRAQDPLAAPLRPDEPPARRQQPLRALGAANARRRPAPVRGIDGRRPPHLPAHPLAVPPVRPDPDAQVDRPQPDRDPGRARRRGVRGRPRRPAARPGRERREGRRPPRDRARPASCPARSSPATTPASSTSSCAASWPSSTPTPSSRTPRS